MTVNEYRCLCVVQAGLQAIHFAAKSGHVDVACELLNSGASVNASSLVSASEMTMVTLFDP